MKIDTRKVRGFALGTALLVGAIATSWADGAPVGRSAAPAPLEGAWNVTITPYNCATGVEVTAATFLARLSFNGGGTLTETNFNPTFQTGQRSTGLGYWERTGPNAYHAVFEAYVNFTSVVTPPALPRYKRGKQRVVQSLEMADDTHWTSTALVEFTDEQGVVGVSGCFNAHAERLQ